MPRQHRLADGRNLPAGKVICVIQKLLPAFLLGVLLNAAAEAKPVKYADIKKQYPGVATVAHSKFTSDCTKEDRKKRSGGQSYYSVLEARLSTGTQRGIGYSAKGGSPGWDPVEFLLPMAKREILQGFKGCYYLVRDEGETTFSVWRINEERELVRAETTGWEAALYLSEEMFVVGGPAAADGGREVSILDSTNGNALIRLPGVRSAPDWLGVEWPQTSLGGKPKPDYNFLHVYLVGVKQPLLLVSVPETEPGVAGGKRRLHIAGSADSPFWLNDRLLVRARETVDGPRYRLQNYDKGNNQRYLPPEFLQQEFSRIVFLGNADRELELGLDLANLRAQRQFPHGLFAFEAVAADGSRHWHFYYDNNGIGTGASTRLSGPYASMAVVDWSGDGKQWRVVARKPDGNLSVIRFMGEPDDSGSGTTLEALRDDMQARALANAEAAKVRAKERAEEEDRIRRAEAYYADQRAIEAVQLRRKAEAEAARRANSIGAALNSISDSLVSGVASGAPSSPPRGVNQSVYDSRNDSTGAGYNSYQKALQREAERKMRCTGANC